MPQRIFQPAQQFVAGATAAQFSRSEAAADQFATFEKVDHYLRPERRPMLLVGVNNGTDQLVPHDIPFGKITQGDAGHVFEGLKRLDQAGAFVRRQDRFG